MKEVHKKNTESKNLKVARKKNGRIMFLSKSAVCDSKNYIQLNYIQVIYIRCIWNIYKKQRQNTKI